MVCVNQYGEVHGTHILAQILLNVNRGVEHEFSMEQFRHPDHASLTETLYEIDAPDLTGE